MPQHSVPPADAFKVVVNPGYTSAEVTDVEVGESEVLLTLARPVRSGETAGLTYKVPETGAIRDVDGIAAVGVTWVTSPAEVSITAASSPVTDGTVAVFNVSLSSAVSEVLTVAVRVTESGSMLSGTPPASVAFSQGDTSVTLRVPTAADSVVEADSVVVAAVATGTSYTVGTASSATVTVEDDDAVTVTAGGSSGGGSGGGGGGGSGGSRNRPPVVTGPIHNARPITDGQRGWGRATDLRLPVGRHVDDDTVTLLSKGERGRRAAWTLTGGRSGR